MKKIFIILSLVCWPVLAPAMALFHPQPKPPVSPPPVVVIPKLPAPPPATPPVQTGQGIGGGGGTITNPTRCTTNGSDGLAGAPTGTGPYNGLMATYAHPPSWCVAGDDYNIGPHTNTVFLDPYTSYPTTLTADLVSKGCSASSNNIRCTGGNLSNKTISGYDFGLHGGQVLQLDTCTNVTLSDFKSSVGSNGQTPIFLAGSSVGVTPCTGVTIQYGIIDGQSNLNGNFGLVQANNQGQLLFQYMWIKNAGAENIVYGNNATGASSLFIKWSMIDTAGIGFASGTHGDWVQEVNQNGSGGAGGTLDNLQISYNLFRQPSPFGGGATQGLSISSANATQAPLTGGNIFNNVFLALGSNSVTYSVIVNTPNVTNSVPIDNNYFDTIGSQFGVIYYGNFNGGSNTGGPGSGNKNIRTNATINVGP